MKFPWKEKQSILNKISGLSTFEHNAIYFKKGTIRGLQFTWE